MESIDKINQAYLQYVFAVKMWNYADANRIDKEAFDSDITLQLPGATRVLPANMFNTYTDIVHGTENNLSINLGFLLITMDEALQSAGYGKDLGKPYPNQDLRILIYMMRN